MQHYLCHSCFNEVEYVCPRCGKPLFHVVDFSKTNIDMKGSEVIDEQSKYYLCLKCREAEYLNMTLTKEEDLIRLKNYVEGEGMPEVTLRIILVDSKPQLLATAEIKTWEKEE